MAASQRKTAPLDGRLTAQDRSPPHSVPPLQAASTLGPRPGQAPAQLRRSFDWSNGGGHWTARFYALAGPRVNSWRRLRRFDWLPRTASRFDCVSQACGRLPLWLRV